MFFTSKGIALLLRIKKGLFGPPSKFKVGDTVQLKNGGYLMVVVEVCSYRNMKQCLLYCQWYESDFHRTRWNLFRESSLMPFDWYTAK
jgi:uncharacterized protein YodC (DUF2158 family)